jgi:UDP-2-acetamido-2,6-beta-L-arabino-hexul-4-ose reductase
VTATFCYNLTHGLPLQINDPATEIELTYIDDVVAGFLAEVNAPCQPGFRFAAPLAARVITLGRLAELLQTFHEHRQTLYQADYSDSFTRALYATYLSYLEPDTFDFRLGVKTDVRGSLAEVFKSPYAGQIFLSRTKPGVTRGNHYHHTKTEKFLVVAGEGIIRFRPINGTEVVEYHVRGEEFSVVDIPPGYVHSIENVGSEELVTLFWACQVFDPQEPDTYSTAVLSTVEA